MTSTRCLWRDVHEWVVKDGLNIRTMTLGINCLNCASGTSARTANLLKDHVRRVAERFAPMATALAAEYGLPITNKRIAVTPVTLLAGSDRTADFPRMARALDAAVEQIGAGSDPANEITFIGGHTALATKALTRRDRRFLATLDEALGTTRRVCGSIEVASTKAGVNLAAVLESAAAVRRLAARTPDGAAAAKFVVLGNAPTDNPFMSGAFHGVGEPDVCVSVGLSAAGAVLRAVEECGPCDLAVVSAAIRDTVAACVRAAERVGRHLARALGVEFGVVDLSLAPEPTPARNSVARILEAMGVERCGAPGTTAALLLLTDAVKKGGAGAARSFGGLSGAFIPVSEDAGMIAAAQAGAITLHKLEAMTSVCSVGMDMIAVPGDTPTTTLAGMISDEMAIGVANNKTTAVRVLPVPGAKAGDVIDLTQHNPLLGQVVVMDPGPFGAKAFFRRPNTRIPMPLRALTN